MIANFIYALGPFLGVTWALAILFLVAMPQGSILLTGVAAFGTLLFMFMFFVKKNIRKMLQVNTVLILAFLLAMEFFLGFTADNKLTNYGLYGPRMQPTNRLCFPVKS